MNPRTGPVPIPARRPRAAVLGALLALTAGGCDGPLGHRSLEEFACDLPIGPEVRRVRLEIEDGRIGIRSNESPSVAVKGGVRRAADTPEGLAALERIPLAFTAAPDPADPTVLVVRAPRRGAEDPDGVFAFELGILVPADLPLEVQMEDSEAIVVADRRAATKVVTGRGDLRFEHCHGGLEGRTGRGKVIAFGCRGDVDLHAKVGSVHAMVPEPGTQLRLVTGQEDVQCFVPRDLGFEVDARAETGKISASAFGLTAESVGRFGAVMTGTHGDGRTKIVLRTGSGHLSVSPLPE